MRLRGAGESYGRIPVRTICIFAIMTVLTVFHPEPACAQVRAKADVLCASAGELLQYDCVIKLANARSGEPISGVTLSVGADMPSMPGIHNVRPVEATEQPEKGVYKARLVLEMHGDWAVQLDLSGAVRDRVIAMLRFEGEQVTEVKRSSGRQKH
jgi:hypothetical protein